MHCLCFSPDYGDPGFVEFWRWGFVRSLGRQGSATDSLLPINTIGMLVRSWCVVRCSVFQCVNTPSSYMSAQGMVKELTPTEARLSNGQVIPFGLCVWSTGVGPTEFINSLPFAKTAKGRLAVDKFLRVLGKSNANDEASPEQVFLSCLSITLWPAATCKQRCACISCNFKAGLVASMFSTF